MDYGNLGRSGLKVSPLCLGCMSFGDAARGGQNWTLDEDGSRAIIRHALEAGINFFDTANGYSQGTSEAFTGRALKALARRDEIVIATKAFLPWRRAPNTGGLSRKALFHAIDDSLARLETDYVDLFQIHRWDDTTPIEETMEALHDIVKSGRARYIGASSMMSWQFLQANMLARAHGWTPFISMQNQLNLIYREEEREMMPLCRSEAIGVIPWSPLAAGRLARAPGVQTPRSVERTMRDSLSDGLAEADAAIIQEVAAIAGERGVSRAQVALAWVLAIPGVTAPIIGAGKISHVDDALAALSLSLSADQIGRLEAPYVAHPVIGVSIPHRTDLRLSVRAQPDNAVEAGA